MVGRDIALKRAYFSEKFYYAIFSTFRKRHNQMNNGSIESIEETELEKDRFNEISTHKKEVRRQS